MTYLARPVPSGNDESLYDAVSKVSQYFMLNPTAPFVELIDDSDGVIKVIGRINNPSLVGTIDVVHNAIYQYERKNAVRTVQINNK